LISFPAQVRVQPIYVYALLIPAFIPAVLRAARAVPVRLPVPCASRRCNERRGERISPSKNHGKHSGIREWTTTSMESLLALFRVAAVKLTSKEESFMVGLIVW